ncbi:hypothetical protein [Sclerotinia sclerotiorum alphaflexivirus 2]|uniref:Uncharacterized protein n=1 Tax=Sclerotinia sclerotiorum alphaflexivirus 2 TaxID=3067704 RepID=A0AA49LP35_9VIRU|nr:hypothetical protein [Sclerotinia sclerotiorum alphaflexivirus 2]
MSILYNDALIVRRGKEMYEVEAEILHERVEAKDAVTVHVDLVEAPKGYRGFAVGGTLLAPYRLSLAQVSKASGVIVSTQPVTADTAVAVAANLLGTVGFQIKLKNNKIVKPKRQISNADLGHFTFDDHVPTQEDIANDDGA